MKAADTIEKLIYTNVHIIILSAGNVNYEARQKNILVFPHTIYTIFHFLHLSVGLADGRFHPFIGHEGP
jgi:hypothetical protein